MPRAEDDDERFYAEGRVPGRFYFSDRWSYSADPGDPLAGHLARFGYTVFDSDGEVAFHSDGGLELIVRQTPSRQQVKLIVMEDERSIPRLILQRFNAAGNPINSGESFHFGGDEIVRLVALLELATSRRISLESDQGGLRMSARDATALLDDATISELVAANPDLVAHILATDSAAPEVIALARRRAAVEEFEHMLREPDHFEQRALEAGGPENAWQRFFEQNRWIFGTSLAPQFVKSWNPDRFQDTIRGSSIAHSGKRPDGVLRTQGAISALMLVEIKHHRAPLLGPLYRADCFSPSTELAGGVAQCQHATDTAIESLGPFLTSTDDQGYDDEATAVCRPRSVLVIGNLAECTNDSGRLHQAKYRCFERFRRSLSDPEVVTFDELLDRARLTLVLNEEASCDGDE